MAFRPQSGWYPSFFRQYVMDSKDSPSDWLFQNEGRLFIGVPSKVSDPAFASTVRIGQTIKFDHWQKIWSTLIFATPGGGWRPDMNGMPRRSDSVELVPWDAVWCPADGEAREFKVEDYKGTQAQREAAAMAAFNKTFLVDAQQSVAGAEFYNWTRDVQFRIEAGEGGPVAIADAAVMAAPRTLASDSRGALGVPPLKG